MSRVANIVRRFAYLGGHTVDPGVLWAVQWILGVVGIFWSLGVGVFVVLGGAEQLTGELYQPLVATFRDYHVIGAVNIMGGILGVVGLSFDRRGISIVSASLCASWNGLLAFFVIPANWMVPGGGNLLGFYAAQVSIVYLLRIVLLILTPGDDAIRMRR